MNKFSYIFLLTSFLHINLQADDFPGNNTTPIEITTSVLNYVDSTNSSLITVSLPNGEILNTDGKRITNTASGTITNYNYIKLGFNPLYTLGNGGIINNNPSGHIKSYGYQANSGTFNNFGYLELYKKGTHNCLLGNSKIFNNHYGASVQIGENCRFRSGFSSASAVINNYATINNRGILEISGLQPPSILNNFSGGIINNYNSFLATDRLNNNPGGIINNMSGGYIRSRETINNSGTINSDGDILIDFNTNILNNNSSGIINNNGSIRNDGLINNNAGATLNNSGVISSYAAFTYNKSDSILNNNSGGTIKWVVDSFNYYDGQYMYNSGTINNKLGATMDINGFNYYSYKYSSLTNKSGGIINNDGGTIIIQGFPYSQGIRNETGCTINNISGGIINNSYIITNDDGTINNTSEGIINNSYKIINDGMIINAASINNNSYSTFNNNTTLTNNVNGIINNNAGTINNNSGGVLTNNFGGIINNNAGTLNNYSGAMLTNNSGGTLTNNATLTNRSSLNNTGTINNDAGNLNNNSGGILNNYSNAMLTNNATLNNRAPLNNAGTLNNDAGNLNNNSGGSITNNSGGMLTNNATLTNVASLNNAGTLNNDAGNLNNNSGGTLNNNSGGILTNSAMFTNNVGGTINNNTGGTLNNNFGGTLTNNDTLTNVASLNNTGILNNDAGNLNNNTDGILNNDSGGMLTNNATLTNVASLNNTGILNNNAGNLNNNTGGTLNNDSGGMLTNNATLTNVASLNNTGILNNNAGNLNNNTGGTLNNYSGGMLTNNATLTNVTSLNNTGTINNYSGTLNNNSGGILNNDSGGTLTNNANLNNNTDGILNNNSGGMLTNSATLTNVASLNNAGTLNNDAGNLYNNSGGTLTNNSGGILNNNAILTNNVGGTITNNTGATLNNTSTLNNYSTFNNSGGILNIGAFTLSNFEVLSDQSLSASVALSAPGVFNNTFGSTVTNSLGSTMNITGTFNNLLGATLDNDGGTINVSGGCLYINTLSTFTNTGFLNFSDGLISLGEAISLELNDNATVTGGTFSLDHSGEIVVRDRTTNLTIPNPIIASGVGVDLASGGLTLDTGNTAVTTLTGANTFTGKTTINSGTLFVNGSVLTPVEVNGSTAVFGGTDTIIKFDPAIPDSGELLVTEGTLLPGANDLFGLLTVEKTLELLSDSTVRYTGVNSVSSDFINVLDAAAIDGTISVDNPIGNFLVGTVIPILGADGGVTGTYSTEDLPLAFNGLPLFEVQYTPNGVNLVVINNLLFFDQTVDPGNPTSVADNIIDNLPIDPNCELGMAIGVLGFLSDDKLNGALNMMHPAAYGTLAWINMNNNAHALNLFSSRKTRRCLCKARSFQIASNIEDIPEKALVAGKISGMSQNNNCRCIKNHAWVQPYGNLNYQGPLDQLIGVDSQTIGVATGYDRRVCNSFLGLGGGYAYTNFTWDENTGNGHINQVYGALYGNYWWNCFTLDFCTLVGGNFYDVDRNIQFAFSDPLAVVDQVAHGDYTGVQWSSHLGLIKDINCWRCPLQILANLDYFLLYQNDFNETGAGNLNLEVNSQVNDMLRTELGGRIVLSCYDCCTCWGYYIGLSWVSKIPLGGDTLTSSFQGQEIPFTVDTTTEWVNQAVPSFGLEVFLNNGFSVGFDTYAELNSDIQTYYLDLNLEYAF